MNGFAMGMNGVPMGMGMGMHPPLSEPAEATGGMPGSSAPPAEPEAETTPTAIEHPSEVPQEPKGEEQHQPEKVQERIVFSPEAAAFMRGRGGMFPGGMFPPGGHPGLFSGAPRGGMFPGGAAGAGVPPMFPLMFAGRGPAFGGFPGMAPKRRGGVVIQPHSEETKVKEVKPGDDMPAPSCPCAEKKADSSSDEEIPPAKSSSSSSEEEKTSSGEENDDDSSSSEEEELLLPPEVAQWCKHQLRRKYFRRMCKAYTAYYTRMTMLSEYYAYQYWHSMNSPYGYQYMPMAPMFPQPYPIFYGQPYPHHHHHHHQPPPQPFAPQFGFGAPFVNPEPHHHHHPKL